MENQFYANKDTITIENEKLKVKILPKLGGKIVSIVYKVTQTEVVAQNLKDKYTKVTSDTPFEKGDASGIDDAFPNINQCDFEFNGKTLNYPDHGEIWKSEFEVKFVCKNQCEMVFVSEQFGYTYNKKISINNDKVIVDYNITNNSNEPLPCFYTLHGLMRVQSDMKLLYPKETNKMINVFKGDALGEVGDVYTFKNIKYDFSKLNLPKNSDGMIKYYLLEQTKEGYCGYVYPSLKTKVELFYDSTILPYLGFWATCGGFRGDYNCAFEPSNGFYDGVDIAFKNNKLFYLTCEKPLIFTLEFKLSKID